MLGNFRSLGAPEGRTRTDFSDKWTLIRYNRGDSFKNQIVLILHYCKMFLLQYNKISRGAPSENIVKNCLDIALLNVF